MSLLDLLEGDFKNGLARYESRLRVSDNKLSLLARPKAKRWDLDLEKLNMIESLIIVGEGGLGDVILFIRYMKLLERYKARIYLCIQPKLHSLIRNSGFKVILINPDETSKIKNSHWVPLNSLLMAFDINKNNILVDRPYLRPEENYTRKWKKRFSKVNGPIIGLNWKGNRDDNKKKERDFNPNFLIRYANGNKLNMIYLQRNIDKEEKRALPVDKSLEKYQDEIYALADSDDPNDFLEYISIINLCSLIITSATTMAHIAGGLGLRVWTILPNTPDWRWGKDGDSISWYPKMSLFRTVKNGDSTYIQDRIQTELNSLTNRSQIQK